MCFSVSMLFELIPFDCSQMVLLAEVSAKWINFDYLSLTFLTRLWPIFQVSAHHIQDKLAVSFDSSSIGRSSYKWFLTIDAKYSSVKSYNEENSSF